MKMVNSNKISPHRFRLKRKHILFICCLIVAQISCDSEDVNDCFQTDGDIISYTIDLPLFDKIQMEDDIRVILEEGPVQKVVVETGENLIPDLFIEVAQETLVLQNNNGCNFIRDYGLTVVKVTSPNITFIRQASSFELSSSGTLTYPELLIWSNTNGNALDIQDPNKSGSVILNVDMEVFNIQANGSSGFEISGRALKSNINFSDEFPQFDGRNFLVNDLVIRNVGAADMIVHPINSIQGQIRATGDVIAVNEPPVVDVEEFFTGKLIFE